MKPLGMNIEELRADFESVTGKPFKYYFCPILHVDEDVPLCGGHVVPQSVGGSSKVLQRKDVDNNFGSFFEAEAGDAIMHDLDGNPSDTILRGDPEEISKIKRRFKPQILIDGTNETINASYRKMGNEVGLVVPRDDLRKLGDEPETITVVHSLDARSSILATSLRTNHLCWFQKHGYEYVFSNEGIFVAWVLRSFYKKFIEPRYGPKKNKKGSLISDEVKREVNDYCQQFANFIRPLPKSSVETLPEEIQRGTPDSGWFKALWDEDQIYGKISIVKLGDQHIGVMTPVITDARGWALFNLALK